MLAVGSPGEVFADDFGLASAGSLTRGDGGGEPGNGGRRTGDAVSAGVGSGGGAGACDAPGSGGGAFSEAERAARG